LTSEPSSPSATAPGDLFATTHWTVVLAAGRRASPEADGALEELCRAYWFPLYAYVRRRGHSREDAEDLTQAFFARFLAKNYLEGLSADRGRFRAFLLAALKHFLANEWDKSQRQKRGGQIPHLSLDWQTADAQFQLAAPADSGPDQAFDREWAIALLARVIERLAAEYEADGRGRQFAELKGFLAMDRGTSSHADAARSLGLSAGAVRVAVHRLRKCYRQLLRDEIGQTVADAAQVEEEIQALFGAFKR
jgi:RNA polymerase sigma-70 factor (ECF subfamily)